MEHYEDIVQERVHLDLCSNLRCIHPEVEPASAKAQLSRQFERGKKQAKEDDEESKETPKKRIYCDLKGGLMSFAKVKVTETACMAQCKQVER